MAKHTPGPWEVVAGPNGLPSHIAAPSARDDVPGVGSRVTRPHSIVCPSLPEAQANARLLASAPTMLATLEWIVLHTACPDARAMALHSIHGATTP